jgi:hypothetical protein
VKPSPDTWHMNRLGCLSGLGNIVDFAIDCGPPEMGHTFQFHPIAVGWLCDCGGGQIPEPCANEVGKRPAGGAPSRPITMGHAAIVANRHVPGGAA